MIPIASNRISTDTRGQELRLRGANRTLLDVPAWPDFLATACSPSSQPGARIVRLPSSRTRLAAGTVQTRLLSVRAATDV